MAERAPERKTRRGSGSLYLTVIVALMLLAAILGLSVFFKIAHIYVEGISIYSAEEVIAVSGIEYDESILFLSESAAAVKIRNALSYVDEVRIVRTLPGTVTIQVTESYPIAWVSASGKTWILDKNLKVLEEAVGAPSRHAIELRGVTPIQPAVGNTIALGADQDVRMRYLRETLNAILKAGVQNKVAWLDMTNISAVTFLYEDRFTVDLGKGEEVSDKLWLLGKIAETHPGTERAKVDLSEGTVGHYIPE